MSGALAGRRDRLAGLVREAGLRAAAFVPGANFYYLTGLHFHLMERPTIVFVTASAEVLAIMPELERQKWRESFDSAPTFFWQDADGFDAAFAAAAGELGDGLIGVEGGRMRVFEAEALRKHFGAERVVDGGAGLADLRICKEPAEVEATERAVAISETALGETLEQVKAGMSEREIANMLKMRMLDGGADGFAFEPIVLAGGKSANPHGVPDGTRLAAGDPLLFDFGAIFDGYNADITRTVFCEHVSDEHARVYETVLAANEKGRQVAGPGLSAHELDTQTTQVLSASAFADMIVHKTGHGLGLDVHETPYVMVGNHQRLEPGMLLTIEPGLYRTGDIGVRIEDDVLIEADGARSLTGFDRALTVVGE